NGPIVGSALVGTGAGVGAVVGTAALVGTVGESAGSGAGVERRVVAMPMTIAAINNTAAAEPSATIQAGGLRLYACAVTVRLSREFCGAKTRGSGADDACGGGICCACEGWKSGRGIMCCCGGGGACGGAGRGYELSASGTVIPNGLRCSAGLP